MTCTDRGEPPSQFSRQEGEQAEGLGGSAMEPTCNNSAATVAKQLGIDAVEVGIERAGKVAEIKKLRPQENTLRWPATVITTRS